jgi:hypothetical protein
MIHRILRTALLVAAAAGGAFGTASAQLEENLGVLSSENAKGYLQPLAKGLSATMNSSVFQTGRVPKQGFVISFGARLAGVTFDDADRTYSPVDQPGFTSTAPVEAPTVIGDTKAVSQSGAGGTTMLHPGGFDVEEFAFGSPQLSVGALFGTIATFRFVTIDIGNSDLGRFDLLGIGAQHSISQYFPDLPLDLAVGAFWQNFKVDDDLVDADALHFNVTGSKQFGWIQPYVGLGYDTLDMTAEYTSSATGNIKVDFDQEANFHGTLGGLARWSLLSVFAEVNTAAQTGFAVGFSVGSI